MTEQNELIKRTTERAKALADMYESMIISRKSSSQRHYSKPQSTSNEYKGKSLFERSAALKSELYRQLDDLEQTVNNDFARHRAETLNMSFNDTRVVKADDNCNETRPVAVVSNYRSGRSSGESNVRALSDVSAHSDREILGDLLINNKNNNNGAHDCGEGSRIIEDPWIPDQDLVDDKYSVSPLINHPSQHSRHLGSNIRTISPGQYFGARSLPLDSFEDMWIKPQFQNSNEGHNDTMSGTNEEDKEEKQTEDPLASIFKALPKTLKHRHQIADRGCIVEPFRLVLSTATGDSSNFGCLRIRSTRDADQTFSLFSARSKLRFLPREGILPALGNVDVMVRLRKSAVHDLSKKGASAAELENILLLMNEREAQHIPVDIEQDLVSEKTTGRHTHVSQDEADGGQQPPWEQYERDHKRSEIASDLPPPSQLKGDCLSKCRFCALEQLGHA